jgi:hypothetical protein
VKQDSGAHRYSLQSTYPYPGCQDRPEYLVFDTNLTLTTSWDGSKIKTGKRPLSLAPLSFDEAVTDILKIKPEPKPPKKKRSAKKRVGK